jgi:hypothetical protein
MIPHNTVFIYSIMGYIELLEGFVNDGVSRPRWQNVKLAD